MSDVQEKIKQLVTENKVVIFMKGSRDFPQCGFSGATIQALKATGADFVDIDVLKDPAIRQGVKVYADWPTIPQVYVGGEFIGGCDIVVQMHQKGELKKVIDEA